MITNDWRLFTTRGAQVKPDAEGVVCNNTERNFPMYPPICPPFSISGELLYCLDELGFCFRAKTRQGEQQGNASICFRIIIREGM